MPKGVDIKEVRMGTMGFKPDSALIDALSPRLYSSKETALGEIVANGRDACIRKRGPIEIHIKTFSGNNPWFSDNTMVVTDRGCGFPTQKNWHDYLAIGHSASAERPELFGVNGLGKFAPLYFADEFTLRTCPDNGVDVRTVKIHKDTVFTGESPFFLGRRGDLPTDSESGSFTSIIIENMFEPYPPDEIMEDLTNRLAIEERLITVNGVPIPPRKTIGDAIKISTEKPLARIGVVRCEIGVTEKSSRADTIKLLGGGREICNLIDVPLSHRRQIPAVFFHPHLYGWIDVERWLKKATVGKAGLRADALAKGEWTSFTKALDLYFKKPIEEAMGQMDLGISRPDRLVENLRAVTRVFQSVWGEIDPKTLRNFGFAAKGKYNENGVSGVRKPGGGKTGTTKPTGKGSKKKRTDQPGQEPGTRTTSNPTFLLKIQDEIYQLYPVNTVEPWPSYVGQGNIINISVHHPRFERVLRRGSKAVITFLEQVIVEAHVRHHRPGEGPATYLSEVYDLLSNIES